MGRKQIDIDIAEVERLAGLGLTEGEICDCIGINQRTLERRKNGNVEFVEAIKRGKSSAKNYVASKLLAKVESMDLGAIIWYEKTRSGFKEPVTRVAETDAEGNDKSGLTDDELLERAAAVIAKRKANAT